jgi:NADPH-dependent curcumin reductase CurA
VAAGRGIAAVVNRRVVLAETPIGRVNTRHFRVVASPLPPLPPGHVLVRVILLQVAPAARAVLTNTAAFPVTQPGEALFGAVVGEVIEGPAPGTIVTCFSGWQEFSIVPLSQIHPVSAQVALEHHVGVLGHNGLAAYFGMLQIGDPKAGETVLVSAAAGGVGHLAGQLANIVGARVIGITGSADKNRMLEAELGFAATVDRRSPTFVDDLRSACPGGVHVYFDNVGGPVLDAALPLMADHGRVVCCGAVAGYDEAEDAVTTPRPRGVPMLIINKALRLQGFLTSDFITDWADAHRRLTGWMADGQLKAITRTWQGLDSAPDALVGMLAGENVGQVVVRVGPDRS